MKNNYLFVVKRNCKCHLEQLIILFHWIYKIHYGKLLMLVIALLLPFTLVGCGKTQQVNSSNGSPLSNKVVVNSLAMSIKPNKQEYHRKEDAIVIVRLQNMSDDFLTINNSFNVLTPNFTFYFREPSGKFIMQDVMVDGGDLFGPQSFVVLHKKEAIEMTVEFNLSVYQLEAGNYEMWARYENNRSPDPSDYTRELSNYPVWIGKIDASYPIRIMP